MPELLQLGLAIAAAGVMSGLLAGLFGIGGGAVMVPVLYQTFIYLGIDEAVRMHLAVGSSIAVIVPTSIRSFTAHRARGAVDMDLLRSWVIAVPLGAIAAALAASVISGGALRGIFAVVAAIFGLRLLLGGTAWRLGNDLPGNPARTIVGGSVGFISALLGIGGGIPTNAFMTLFGRSIRQAVATSSGVGVLMSVPALFGLAWAGWGAAGLPDYSVGFISLPVVAILIPISVAVAPLGVRLAHRLPHRALEIAFGAFQIVVAARFAVSLL